MKASCTQRSNILPPQVELFGWACLAIAICTLLLAHFGPPVIRKRGRTKVADNAKLLSLGLMNYHEVHGRYPSDPRGADYALYSLREFVDVTAFDLIPAEDPLQEAHWDHSLRRLQDSDFHYWNPSTSSRIASNHVLMVSRRPVYGNEYYLFVLSDGEYEFARTTGDFPLGLLGKFVTFDFEDGDSLARLDEVKTQYHSLP